MIMNWEDVVGLRGGQNSNIDDDDNADNNMNDNNITTIKQCMGLRGRRKTVAAMDDGQ
jgi:hypothetical protein